MDRGAYRHAYWLGGFSCCGKTTVATKLDERFGLLVQHLMSG
jgi:adenylylsulfate kinase-like enzyme